ncbi:Eco57I restriction-modification methylase domain-containing protein [Gulosibacter sediminis]|uniref:Eco57I restriction-modification methylase domain-containing protein n=1 Tax=Gulosibacter sediminis TaxID=1729695 RepID=UPI001868FD90|nr:Eco57I restriction-modification methylase domain-containing protein [Gulosibacter sediminis]
MAAVTTKTAAMQKRFTTEGLTGVFVSELFWDAPTGTVAPIEIEEVTFVPKVAAQLKGFRVYTVACDTKPTPKEMKAVHNVLAPLSAECMELFQASDYWYWHWPRTTAAGTTTFERVATTPGVLPAFMAQRLAGLIFTQEDHQKGFYLTDVLDRIHGHFDASNVTKKFYDRFAKEHQNLAKEIAGLTEGFAKAYSTTLLNRLMFLYFMQKKEFLNGDLWYLEHTLQGVQQLRGRDQYYGFYRDALLPLFFEKLNEKDKAISDPEIERILGRVPYVNGGLFGPTSIEEEFGGQITIPDTAFERILGFFSEYTWHLDTAPAANDEINPDVLGYIFEQFVNSKQMGAYYTKEDVTHFMTRSTLLPVIVSHLEKIGVPVWDLLASDPERYIWDSLRHGTEYPIPADIDAERVSHRRPSWLGEVDGQYALPGESWWEIDARRDYLAAIRDRLTAGEISTVDAAVSANINIEVLAVDAIKRVSDPAKLRAIWVALTELHIIDPTCGSGAFLFAALNLLMPVYEALLETMDLAERGVDPELDALRDDVDGHKGGRDYFLLKHACLANLYGVDIMPEAVEVARLRLFLKLASAISDPKKIEPLPDLDFNIKAGNMLVGARTPDEIDIASDGLLIADDNSLRARESSEKVKAAYSEFRQAQEADNAMAVKVSRGHLRSVLEKARAETNQQYYAIEKRKSSFDEWVLGTRPFHWFIEFPEVLDRDGFDVVIGNPPYIKKKDITEYSYKGFKTDALPDIYAPCTERAAQITGPDGRMALIIPISASFSDDFAKLREVLETRFGRLWVSNFSRNPAALFSAGLGVRSTIVVGHRGDGEKELYVTKTHRWYDAYRPALFETLQYVALPAEVRKKFGWVRLPSSAYGRIVGIAGRTPGSLASLERPRSGVASVGFKQTALYWLAVFLDDPPAYERDGRVAVQTKIGRISTESRRAAKLLLAIAASKFAFVWWYTTGDDFDVTSGGIKSTPIDPNAFSNAAQDKLVDLASRLVDAFPGHVLFTPYAGKFMGTYVLSEMRDTTDAIDQVIAEELGFVDLLPALEHAYACVFKPTGDRPGTLRYDPFVDTAGR